MGVIGLTVLPPCLCLDSLTRTVRPKKDTTPVPAAPTDGAAEVRSLHDGGPCGGTLAFWRLQPLAGSS